MWSGSHGRCNYSIFEPAVNVDVEMVAGWGEGGRRCLGLLIINLTFIALFLEIQ